MKSLRFRFYLILFIGLSSVFFYASCERSEDCTACEVQELTEEQIEAGKIELGRKLFFDKKLSSDNSISCASCHKPELAFADDQAISKGVEGRLGFRNAPTLLNLKDADRFMFDAEIDNLEEQALVPIQDHDEMNMPMGDLVKKLKTNANYVQDAQRLFNRELDAFVITRALAAFQKTLVSNNSRFDQFMGGDSTALTEEEVLGWEVFQQKGCVECHRLPHFTDYRAHKVGMLWSEDDDDGRFRVTHDSLDFNSFKTPSLRNIELTAPYLHNGSVKSLKVMLLYHQFGDLGQLYVDSEGVSLNPDLVEYDFIIPFLKSLTDTTYLKTFN